MEGVGAKIHRRLFVAMALTKFCENLIDTYPSFSQRNTAGAICVLH
jgi:hypothetical protein